MHSKIALQTLESILVPGGRSRVSPYIQDAQFHVLFGEFPDPENRHEHMKKILREKKTIVNSLADTYIKFREHGLIFAVGDYQNNEFLKSYLAYYLTTNLAKIQLCLLDLVRDNKLAGSFDVVDIGVGAGTTALAVLDFFLAWSIACQLCSQTFPVKAVHIRCYDRSSLCLDTAKSTTEAFCESILRRQKSIFGQKVMASAMGAIIEWGASIDWIKLDIGDAPIPYLKDRRALLFASNIVSELTPQGTNNLKTSLINMPQGSIATIIEPGDEKSSYHLNKWKCSLLGDGNRLISLYPCGDFSINEKNKTTCSSCWNSRRASLNEPVLFRYLREHISTKIGDRRGFDEFNNKLLSWTYAILTSAIPVKKCISHKSSERIFTRVMGTLSKSIQDKKWELIENDPDKEQLPNVEEYIKLCPVITNKNNIDGLRAKRTLGFICPPIRHGSPVLIQETTLESAKVSGNWWALLSHEGDITPIDLPTDTELAFLAQYDEPAKEAIDEIAFRLFGFKTMRPFQHEILSRVLMGKNILGIAATGGGKSECFILPAMLFPGVTIVVSPLKSLMQDQYDKRIDERYGLRYLTTFINGDVSFIERQARLKRLELGYYKLVYFTPEQLQQTHVLTALKCADEHIGIRYLALDEAHCISQWGHDFRDSYLNLVSRLRKAGINPVRIALTATASPAVRVDLCEELDLINETFANGGDVYVHSSNRAELNFIVQAVRTSDEKVEDIISRLQKLLRKNVQENTDDSAIIFMPHTGTNPDLTSLYFPMETKSNHRGRLSAGVTSFASWIERSLETKVAIYHSKMDSDNDPGTAINPNEKKLGDLSGRKRRSQQNAFMENERSIMVATKGFGMGIDKSNIRLIIHRTPTANLEAYAQEAGRAGRDGEISDVVLYYSPDSNDEDGRVRNDYEIQDFFLKEKYIRKEDVLAIWKFLHSSTREIAKHIYFTSDEILPYFNNLQQQGAYSWPNFPPRIKRPNEFSHAEFFDRGYIYTQKINYIERILSVLYRIRPDIGPAKKVCLITSFQETGAKIICRPVDEVTLNAPAITNSNAYFGIFLREKRISPNEFKKWIEKAVAQDAVEFARHLNIPLSELVSMLWDINRSEGKFNRNGKWISSLLDFLFISTPRYGAANNITSDTAWRNYAGAMKRQNKTSAVKRAEQALANGETREFKATGEIKPTDDDWFSSADLAKPKGWEIFPSIALSHDDYFYQYLDAFMRLHDRRRENDRSAYNLLLTDYVGVNENGTLPHSVEKKPCLRAVMLGYLKTGEVVLGNCRSCSRCVPDGRFEKDKSKREKIVERLGIEIIDLLDIFEKNSSQLPPIDLLTALWNQVETQEQSGRSLRAYVEGWTGRLLTDTPGHKAAIWVRIDGMVKGFLTLQPQEACARSLELLNEASKKELPLLWETITLFSNIMPDVPEALEVLAIACHLLERFTEEKKFWFSLLEQKISQPQKHKAHAALTSLFAEPLEDLNLYKIHALEAARTAGDFKAAQNFYEQVSLNWDWETLREEFLIHQQNIINPEISANLLDWWIKNKSDISIFSEISSPHNWAAIIKQTVAIIEENNELGRQLAKNLDYWTLDLLKQSPHLICLRALRLAISAAKVPIRPGVFAEEAMIFLTQSTPEHRQWLSNTISESGLSCDLASIKAINGELAFQSNDVHSAAGFWRSCLDSFADVPEAISEHLLKRFIDIFKPNGIVPDHEAFYETLKKQGNKNADWQSASIFYEDVIDTWNWNKLQEMLNWSRAVDNYGWFFGLLELWLTHHGQCIEDNNLFAELSQCDEKTLNVYGGNVQRLLTHLDQFSLAMHPVWGPIRLNAVIASDIFGNKSEINKSNFSGEIEFSCYAVITGLIDDAISKKQNVGRLIFYMSDDFLFEKMTDKCVEKCRKDIIEKEHHYFFNVYQPNSAKSLNHWLRWFMPLLDTKKEFAIYTIKGAALRVLEKILSKDKSRSNITKFLDVMKSHHIDDLDEKFTILNRVHEFILTAESQTQIHTVYDLTSSHIYNLEWAISPHDDEFKADVLVSLLREIRARCKKNWLTPLSQLIKALTFSGRTNEAMLSVDVPDFRMGKEKASVDEFVKKYKGQMRNAPTYDSLLSRIAILYLNDWKCWHN